MSDMNLSLLIQAKDQATQTLRNVQGEMKSFSQRNRATFRNMALAWTVAFGAISAWIAKATTAFQAQERAEARLEQIARQVTGATDEQIESFKNLSKELQSVWVVGDEVLIAWQSQIASFTKNAEVVNILTKDIADLAVAQYWVNVSQEQAIQTSNILGKALQWQLGALTRTGILVNEDFRKAFENANTEQERAIVLSQIIQDNYGWLNESMRQTAEWGMQAMRNSVGDLWEVMGARLAPAIASVAEKLVPLINRVADWISENDKLFANIVLGAWAIAWLVAVVWTLWLALPTIMVGITAITAVLSWPVGLIALVGAVTAWLYLWANQSMTTEERIHATKNAMNDLNLAFANGEIAIDDYNSQMTIHEQELADLEARKRNFGAFLRDNFIDTIRQVGNTFDYVWIAIRKVIQRGKEALEWFKAIGGYLAWSFMTNLGKIASMIERISWISLPSLSSIGWAISNTFGGARANGWPVRAWTSYLVGERWPELFTASRSGQIVPNWWWGIDMSGWTLNVSNEADEDRLVNKIKQVLSRETRDFNSFGVLY